MGIGVMKSSSDTVTVEDERVLWSIVVFDMNTALNHTNAVL